MSRVPGGARYALQQGFPLQAAAAAGGQEATVSGGAAAPGTGTVTPTATAGYIGTLGRPHHSFQLSSYPTVVRLSIPFYLTKSAPSFAPMPHQPKLKR